MQRLILIQAFAQVTGSLKHANFVNYGDLLKEIYSDPYLSADRELLVASDNYKNEITSHPKMLKMSVKDLLDMNHHFVQSSNHDSYHNKPSTQFSSDNRNLVHDEEYYIDKPTNTSSESFEAHMEEMLGKDFFEDQKFLLFVIFSCVLLLLMFCCLGVTVRWCWMSVCRAQETALSPPSSYTALSLPSPDTSLSMYSDTDTPYPDEIFLQGRKLYPGVL